MHITKFQAIYYRNIREAEVHFVPGVNLLWGDNAQGKTNLLEGIYTFARGKSFRGASDEEICHFGETNAFSISLAFESAGRSSSLAYRYQQGSRERLLNGAPVSRLSEMIGHFRAVLFYPDHLQLIKGGPGERRLFLNIAISQIKPMYVAALSRYEKWLKNRNALLKEAQKTGRLDRLLLDSYSEKMAEESEQIGRLRHEYIKKLEPVVQVLMGELSGGREQVSLVYRNDIGEPTKQGYVDKYSQALEREIAAGCTLYGTHRDEMEIYVNGKDARSFASQGQMRSLVLCLKLGEGEVAKEASGEYPVFLFDDVLSELDEGRRAFILRGTGERQIIMTSCERRGFEGIATNEICVRDGVYGGENR